MQTVSLVFKALSDPVRLQIVHRLCEGENFTLGTVSVDLGISRQGARKHLLVLEEAQIVHLSKKGRATQVRLEPHALLSAKQFISELESQWDRRLLALKNLVEER